MNRRGKLAILLLVLGLLSWWTLRQPACAQSPPSTRILFVNSYHHGYRWSDGIVAGAFSVLKRIVPNENIHVEYLDSKRFLTPEYQSQFTKLFTSKYADMRFDIVVASDDYAYDFVCHCRDQLFPGVPIVFCGVSRLDPEQIRGRNRNVTGVLQVVDAAPTVNLALRLHPKTETIYVVAGATTTLQTWHPILEQATAEHPGVKTVFLNGTELTTDQLAERIRTISGNAIVLVAGWNRDSTGDYLVVTDVSRRICSECTVPIYTLDLNWLENGAFGGKISLGFPHGVAAGELALRVLDGNSPDSIPIRTDSTNPYMFDYSQLRRFGIPESVLPEGSMILNRPPPTAYEQHKGLVWSAVALILLLLAMVAALGLNVAKRHRAEAEVRDTNAMLQTFMDAAPVAFARSDLNGNFEYRNRRFVDLFGYTEREVNTVHDWFHKAYPDPEYRESVMQAWNTAVEAAATLGEAIPRKDVEVTCLDGSIRHVTIVSALVENKTLVFFNDITDRVEARKRDELHQKQLVQADKLASVGLMAAGIAHEINNPTNLVMMNAGVMKTLWEHLRPLLAREEGEIAGLDAAEALDDFGELLEGVAGGAERIKKIVQNMKDFARLDSGQTDNVVSPHEVIESAMTLCRNLFKKATDHLDTDLAKDLPAIEGNQQKLEQVLINLFSNACQALTDREQSIRITSRLDPEQQAIVIEVTDEGGGISEENLGRILDPFFTTKRDTGGTGLGLSVSYGIVEEHGGKLEFESQEGKGTTARVILPAAESQA